MKTPLVNPDRYFCRETVDTKTAMKIVGLSISLAISFIFSVATLPAIYMNVYMSVIETVGVLFAAVVLGTVLILGYWLVMGTGLYSVSKVQSGNGSFMETMKVVSWGLVPFAIVISLMFLYIASLLSTTTSHTKFQSVLRQLTSSDDLLLIVMFFSMSVWQTYIWTYAIIKVHGITQKRAAFTAGLVAMSGFLFAIF